MNSGGCPGGAARAAARNGRSADGATKSAAVPSAWPRARRSAGASAMTLSSPERLMVSLARQHERPALGDDGRFRPGRGTIQVYVLLEVGHARVAHGNAKEPTERVFRRLRYGAVTSARGVQRNGRIRSGGLHAGGIRAGGLHAGGLQSGGRLRTLVSPPPASAPPPDADLFTRTVHQYASGHFGRQISMLIAGAATARGDLGADKLRE